MRRQVLFVQGAGAGTHDDWDQRLVASLERGLGTDYAVEYPRMPYEADPTYLKWKRALEAAFDGLGDGAVLVGHSFGATVLVNAIAAGPPRFAPGGVFLVAAPFAGEGGWPVEGTEPRARLGSGLPEGVPICLYHGERDETVPVTHLDLYARAIPRAVIRRLPRRDHQLNDDLSPVAADILERC
ncbi:MAG: alpha/beta fold hydrolase [Amaricoccus sp.]